MCLLRIVNRCVYEMFFAGEIGVRVKLAPHISETDLFMGGTDKDICANEANKRYTRKKHDVGIQIKNKTKMKLLLEKQ